MSRLIDADALKELFSEVIGHIAKKPEMNGNLEHMIRASAMVIQMIDDAPTVNALNCSEIPNNSDVISRQAALETIRTMQTYKLFAGDDMLLIDQAEAQTELMMLPSAQPEQRWVPCRERLPEEGEVVLTQAKFKDDVKMAVSSRIDYNYWTGWGTRDINIIAWMPLPEPARLEND